MSQQRLRDLLGEHAAELPDLAALGEDGQARLGDCIEAAQRRQDAELKSAVEEALGHVPRLLRRPLRKLLFRE